jgi:hypothetical protein
MLFKITPATTLYHASAFGAAALSRDERIFIVFLPLIKEGLERITRCLRSGRGQNPQMPHEEHRRL